ncbi:MAG: monovalent cation/H(+) antiporter subunit G [Acidiferrobacterales bacterium]|nr:monovalent cation/H(+) antiporter subunit G [Acidiferrobacterales bacterium]
MTEQFLPIVRDICLVAGVLCVLVGSLGVLRFPDFFSRIHATGITETAGIGFIVAGLIVEAGISLVAVKLLFILIFIFLTSPTSSHALAKTAIHAGLAPLTDRGGNRPSN